MGALAVRESNSRSAAERLNTMKFTPNNIQSLEINEVFVFGSNSAGLHLGGAARLAHQKFGAVWGMGTGHHGQTYAIPTMDAQMQTLPVEEIGLAVDAFRQFASLNPNLTFLVTQIGCGIAGHKVEEIAPLFFDSPFLENVILPEAFWEVVA